MQVHFLLFSCGSVKHLSPHMRAGTDQKVTVCVNAVKTLVFSFSFAATYHQGAQQVHLGSLTQIFILIFMKYLYLYLTEHAVPLTGIFGENSPKL